MTDSTNSSAIVGASVFADTGQSDTTDANGDYQLDNVPTGTPTLTVSATGYVTQQRTTSVTDGGTTTEDFALDPEATGGGTGKIKGTVMDGGTRLEAALVVTGSQSDDTNKRGMYMLKDVPAGVVSLTASFGGCTDGMQIVTLPAGTTITVDFTGDTALTCP